MVLRSKESPGPGNHNPTARSTQITEKRFLTPFILQITEKRFLTPFIFAKLGPLSVVALPELENVVQFGDPKDDTTWFAAEAIGRVGPLGLK